MYVSLIHADLQHILSEGVCFIPSRDDEVYKAVNNHSIVPVFTISVSKRSLKGIGILKVLVLSSYLKERCTLFHCSFGKVMENALFVLSSFCLSDFLNFRARCYQELHSLNSEDRTTSTLKCIRQEFNFCDL